MLLEHRVAASFRRDKVGDEILKMAWIVQDLILRDLNFISYNVDGI